MDPFTDLYVVSPLLFHVVDTDVLLLLIYYYPQLCASTTFRTGSGNDQRDIEIRKMHESVGPLHAKAILGFHVFTGCDKIGRFYGKSKLEYFRIFTDCQREKLDGFIALGSTESIDSLDNLIEMLQEFVLNLYCRHRPDAVKDIATLRYYLFSKYQKNLEHLPPTVETLQQKAKRSYYVAHVLKHALDAHPFYPDLTSCGWVLSEGTLAPIATEDLPAPSKMI